MMVSAKYLCMELASTFVTKNLRSGYVAYVSPVDYCRIWDLYFADYCFSIVSLTYDLIVFHLIFNICHPKFEVPICTF